MTTVFMALRCEYTCCDHLGVYGSLEQAQARVTEEAAGPIHFNDLWLVEEWVIGEAWPENTWRLDAALGWVRG